MNLRHCIVFSLILFCACSKTKNVDNKQTTLVTSPYYIKVLGIAQDGGYPHINNTHEFEAISTGANSKELVVSLGLIDKENNHKYLFEATPDMPEQLYLLGKDVENKTIIDGVFLTHAHIGHYTGLMHFGREAMGAKNIPVFTMPLMQDFLESNGPWNQLIDLNNITIQKIVADRSITLSRKLKITPFLVPHRDEFSETVGYRIEGPNKTALFIPDIDKWSKWEQSIVEEVRRVDYAFLDATFFSDGEISRPMNEVPHPFIEETVALFEETDFTTKSKIIFIHFNHSNVALERDNPQRLLLEEQGYHFAEQGATYEL